MSDREKIDEIKDKIDLVDLISLDCRLDENGRGAHENSHDSESGNCLSVFIDEHNEQKWKCHHCKQGGDCFDWIADRDSLDIDKDFPEILERAAEYAGVDIDNHERKRVFACLTAAAEHFHSNLTNDMYNDIEARWGISRETVDKFKIGMSKIDSSLEEYLSKQGFTNDEMLKSGLFSGNIRLFPFFKGRYTFPYWVHGEVRYFAARATEKTPKTKYEKTKKGDYIKYKKLRTHTKKAEYISRYVKNDVMFGIDSLTSGDFCVITEGIADAVMAIQAGFPCVSPVTTKFRKADQESILRLVKSFKKVYICMDNEVNEAGAAGAYSVCKHLIDHDIDASIVELPRPPDVKKIDLADYLHENDADSFRNLLSLAYKPPEFFKPPPEQFLITSDSGKTKFSPLLFADWLINESNHHFKAFFDDHSVVYYMGGVYRRNGETIIAQFAEDIMKEWISNRTVSEIIGHVERQVYTEREEFDKDPYIINLQNCLYDLENDKVMPHTPDFLSLNQLPVKYDPDATCELWDKFSAEVVPNTDDRRTIMEMFGLSLLKTSVFHNWFILLGEGGNGKGTLVTVLERLIGAKNVSAVALQNLENAFSTAQMYGKMANICADLSRKDLWQTGILKQLTGGDIIHAQFKNQPIFEFTNYATMIFATNYLPMTYDDGIAFRRRVVLIKFLNNIPPERRIIGLDDKLSQPECLSAVLNFAITGARSVLKNSRVFYRYGEDEVMKIYTEMSDSVTSFLSEHVEYTENDDDKIPKKLLYSIYKEWYRIKKRSGMIAPLKGYSAFNKRLIDNPEIEETKHASDGESDNLRGWTRIIVVGDIDNSDNSRATRAPGALILDSLGCTCDNSTHIEKVRSREVENTAPTAPPALNEEDTKVLLEKIKNAIYRLGFTWGIHEFDVVRLQGEMPKRIGATIERLTELLDSHLEELKIIKMDDKIYKQEE